MGADEDLRGADRSTVAARGLRRDLVDDELIDGAIARAGAGGISLTEGIGFLPEVVRSVRERGLAAELGDHPGFDKGEMAGRGAANSWNGSAPRTLFTDVGPVPISTSRDRSGTFELRLAPRAPGVWAVAWTTRSSRCTPAG